MASRSQLRSKSRSKSTQFSTARPNVIQSASRSTDPTPTQMQQQLGNRATQAWLAEQAPVQHKSATSETAIQSQDRNAQGENRTGITDPLKSGLEQLSGIDLSGIRVHRNSSKPAQLNALAYTQGQEIHLAPGQEKHLPHEGWHVVQQMRGRVKPTVQAKGVSINDDAGLEHEADEMGAKAIQAKQTGSKNLGHQLKRSTSTRTSTQLQRFRDPPAGLLEPANLESMNSRALHERFDAISRELAQRDRCQSVNYL